MPEKKKKKKKKNLWKRTYSIRDQVPTCPVFTRVKIKPCFGILVNLPSHIRSMRLKSTDCAGQDKLFLFVFNVPLAEFTSMLWVIILNKYKSLTHKPHSRWDCIMPWYVMIASPIQFVLHLDKCPTWQLTKASPRHNRASSMLYGWCNTGGCSSFSNILLHIDFLIDPKILNFDLSVQRTLFHCSIAKFLCILDYCSLLTLFCFLNHGFLMVILLYRPASQSLLTVDIDTFFHDIGLVVQWCLEQSFFSHAS